MGFNYVCKVVVLSVVLVALVEATSHTHEHTECDTEKTRNDNRSHAERDDCEKYAMSEQEFLDCSWSFTEMEKEITKIYHKCIKEHSGEDHLEEHHGDHHHHSA